MRRLAILYPTVMTLDGKRRSVGGVETYLSRLIPVAKRRGLDVVVVQHGATAFVTENDGVPVHGVPTSARTPTGVAKALMRRAAELCDPKDDILLFASDVASCRNSWRRSILIQHGIFWDMPARCGAKVAFLRHRWPDIAVNMLRQLAALRRFRNAKLRVCVDHNFPHWCKTVSPREIGRAKTWVIPNTTDVLPRLPRVERPEPSSVRVIFARRFEEYRGVRPMVDAAKRIIDIGLPVEFTFAGRGSLEWYIREHLANCESVRVAEYHPSEATSIHAKHDIAVIPSLGSEGTSLAVLEAQASGCAVIASPVGGITDLILDGFNGAYAAPTAEALTTAICDLVRDSERRRVLGTNGWRTVRDAFSPERWLSRWSEVLDEAEATACHTA